LITYTKSTVHVDRLAALGAGVRGWTWPDDYQNIDSAEVS
jgi:hypothetical protein